MDKEKRIRKIKQYMKKRPWLVFLAPSLMGVLVFFAIPYMDVFRRAFFSSAGNRFTGLENFRDIFANEAFQKALSNTGRFIVTCIPLLLIISLLISLFLYQHTKIGQYVKTIFLIPMAIPIAAVVLLWNILFDRQGFLNGFLDFFGVDAVDWMNTEYAFWIVVLSYIWKNLGYHIVLWVAGLSMIPENIYEAARMDGAKEGSIFFRITLPNLLPMVFIIVVLALLNSFKVFREAYLVAGDYPHESMYFIQHLFNNWFRDLSLGNMAAGAFFISTMLILLIILLQKAWENRE